MALSSGSRETFTLCYTSSASGAVLPPTIVLRGEHKKVFCGWLKSVIFLNFSSGKRMSARAKPELEPGLSGEWKFCVAPNGFMTTEIFTEQVC